MPVSVERPRRTRRTKSAPPVQGLDLRLILARRLDLLAGCELQHGHAAAAEHLAHRAAELRAVAS